jgi:hypothetical protein
MEKSNKKHKHIWHKQQEKVLKQWAEVSASYRYMHDRAYIQYNNQNMRLALPVIIISTITGTANFAQGSFPASWQTYVPLAIGFLNLSAGLITTIAQFLRVSELLEGHRAATISYSKFSRNISVELSLPYEQRTCGGLEFINKSRSEIDRLIEQSPNIPLNIVKQFGKKFHEYDFMKPQILEIYGVDVYKDDEDEIERREHEILEKHQKREEDIINKERKRRQSLKEEIEEEEQKKKVELSNIIKDRKKQKKKEIGIGHVTNNMSKLMRRLNTKNNIMNPSSSDTESSGDDIDTSMPLNKVISSMKFLAERTQTIVDADDTPIDDTPVDDTPADDTPADDTPADDTPATDVPEDTEIVIDIQDISGNDT